MRAGKTAADAVIPEREQIGYEGLPGVMIAFDGRRDVASGGRHPNLRCAPWQSDCGRELVFPKHVRTADPILPPWLQKNSTGRRRRPGRPPNGGLPKEIEAVHLTLSNRQG